MTTEELRPILNAFILSCVLAFGARKMGHSSITWFLVSFLAGPYLSLALLPTLSDRRLDVLRNQERQQLDRELALAGEAAKQLPASGVGTQTIGDRLTRYTFDGK